MGVANAIDPMDSISGQKLAQRAEIFTSEVIEALQEDDAEDDCMLTVSNYRQKKQLSANKKR